MPQSKQIIRDDLKALRDEMNDEQVLILSKEIKNNLFGLDIFNAENFFVYLSFKNEASTGEIIDELRTRKKRIFVPKIIAKDMKMVELTGKSAIIKNKFEIFEPVGEMLDVQNFVAIMPCLAVDESGNRIGFGGGYYDRFLKDKQVLKIAICYDFQVVSSFVPEEFDVPVDIIVTDKRVIYCNKIKNN